ncbi:MAG TPA: carotenoid biosynthesis protein [Bacteroidia bacterium]|jgi:putative membrane protein
MSTEQKDKLLFVSTIILVVIHLAGILGIRSVYHDLFLLLSPLNLMISSFLLFLNHKDFNKHFYLFMLLCFFTGFSVEVAGVYTGQIFGEYSYGNTLGYKLLNVPVIIGLNWLMLVYSVGIICHQVKVNKYIKSLMGAGLLVILDFFIEPVAIKYDFWSWTHNQVPIQNYIAWFITAFLLLLLFNNLKFNKTNRLAKTMYIIQLVFFVLLSVF